MIKKWRHKWQPKNQRDWIVLTVCAMLIVFAVLILILSFTVPMVQLGFFRTLSIGLIMATLVLYHVLISSGFWLASRR